MATIAEQLTSLANTKTAIKDAIVAKGVSVADTDTFASYADKIGQISGGGGGGDTPTEEWQPNPNWWDIKKILDEDTRDYPGKAGVILYNFNDVSDFQLAASGMTAVATSDGAFYSYADNGTAVSHNWDTSKDKDDGRGAKTRWVIYYFTTDTAGYSFGQTDKSFGWAHNYIAYLVLNINCPSGVAFCGNQRLLEAIDTVGHSISGTNFSSFCSSCNSLTKLPDGLDTSKGTTFNNFCLGCYSLTKLPDGLDTSSGTNFGSFCSSCNSLTKLPDGLDTSKGTNFGSFCSGCSSLQKVPEIIMSANTSAITSKYSGPFYNAHWLKELPLTLPSNTNFWLDSSTRISIESFRYIADHAPDVTATPRTLTVGNTNLSRINSEDPTIITDLNAKGWTVA